MMSIGKPAAWIAAAVLVAGACSGERETPTKRFDSRKPTATAGATAADAASAAAPVAAAQPPDQASGQASDQTSGVIATAGQGSSAAAPQAASQPTPQLSGTAPQAAMAASQAAQAEPGRPGQEFIDEARLLYRVVACAGDAPIPAHLDAQIVDAYCKRLSERKEHYKQRYATTAKEFIATLRPPGLPEVVVYPFGGGDLISALVAYPDAPEITTISLEHAGDPRRIRDMAARDLQSSLAAFEREIGGMLAVSSNTSKNLSAAHTNLLPGQLSSFLVALAVHDFEPVSVRYIDLADDGSLRYLDAAQVQAMEAEQARQLKHDWVAPNFSRAFSHVEIQFRRRGASADEPVRIHRHFAINLSDAHLKKHPALLAHLSAKGRISAMTKGASYLLWQPHFSLIRNYLLEHMDFMISDSTGIPPFYARKAGMVQIPLGRFTSSFLVAPVQHNQEFAALWARPPFRRLPFRFGYVDAAKQPHLLLTMPADKAATIPATSPAAPAASQSPVPGRPGVTPGMRPGVTPGMKPGPRPGAANLDKAAPAARPAGTKPQTAPAARPAGTKPQTAPAGTKPRPAPAAKPAGAAKPAQQPASPAQPSQ